MVLLGHSDSLEWDTAKSWKSLGSRPRASHLVPLSLGCKMSLARPVLLSLTPLGRHVNEKGLINWEVLSPPNSPVLLPSVVTASSKDEKEPNHLPSIPKIKAPFRAVDVG